MSSDEYKLVYNHLEAIYISQDADISVMNIDDIAAFNYHLYLNISGDLIEGNYVDADNSNANTTALINLDINLDKNDYTSILNVYDPDNYSGNGNLSDESRNFSNNGSDSLKDACVGIISKALFDNFGQRAAISNDMDIESQMFGSINDTLTNLFSNASFQDKMFRRYVASGRYDEDDSNDINNSVCFNFTDSKFRFGISFHGFINERETSDTLLLNSNSILEGAGFNPNGVDIYNIQNGSELVCSYNEPSYQFNVLLEFQQS